MKRVILTSLVFAIATPLVGCKGLLKKRQEGDAAASASAATPPDPPPVVSIAPVVPPPTTAAAETPPPADDAPTPEDFEDEAFEGITAKNFETELARLKKDIGP